ncbi:hypothetical protein [Microbulbifer sp. SAOS-129_SWC]|uniref:hypothetical protein n=1 Tax=Microbulbifer sp. SAOS-129_SWC TaxID=3145235 RepID=UPI003217A877
MYLDIFIAAISAVLFVAQSSLVGLAIITALNPRGEIDGLAYNRYLMLFFSATTGLVVNLLVLFALGIFGWLNPAAIAVGACALFFLAAWIIRHDSRYLLPTISNWKYTDGLILVALLLGSIVAAIHPPGHWDDTMYHLPLARYYLEQKAIVVNDYLRFPLFPQYGDLLVMLGLMLGHEVGAQLFATIPLLLICIGLFGASLWKTRSLIVGMIAIYFLYRLGPVKSTLGYAYIDNTLALFSWGAVLALVMPKTSISFKWILISGFFAGAAAGSKYFGLVLAGLMFLYILLFQRNIKMLVMFSGAAILTGVWWYVRNIVIAGDPFHPAGGSVFGYYLWNAADLKLQVSEQARHGVSPTSLNIFAALGKAKAKSLILAIVSLLIFKLPKALKPMRALFIAYIVFWFFVTQVERYLAPVYGVGVFLSAYVLYWAVWRGPVSQYFIGKGKLGGQAFAIVVALVFATVIFSAPLKRARWSIVDWQRDYKDQPGHHLFSKANNSIDTYGDRMLQIGFENAIYYFNGTVIGDWYGPGRYRQFFVGKGARRSLLPPKKMLQVMHHFDASILTLSKKRNIKFSRDDYLKYFDVFSEDKYGLVLIKKRL